MKEKADPTVDIKLRTFSFGREAALRSIAEELDFAKIVDDVVDKREEKGLTVGEYMLIQLVGRATGHLSRSEIAEWFPDSVIDFWYSFSHKMNPQNLLNQLDYLGKNEIREIEKRIAINLKKRGFSPSIIYWDTTNFYTEIETENDLAEQGFSKDGKHTKKLVGLALGTTEEGLPIMHEVYPGNERDPQLLNRLIDSIVERMKAFDESPSDFSIVLDGGNNNADNIPLIKEKELGILGRLKRTQVKSILRKPVTSYDSLDPKKLGKKTKRKAYRCKKEVYGENYTIVVEYSPKNCKKKRLTYEADLQESFDKLEEIQRKLQNQGRGRPPTKDGTYKRANKAIKKNVRSVIEVDVEENDQGKVELEFSLKKNVDKERRDAFGKRAIFTDRDNWSTEKIVATYNGRYQVEDDFRVLKNPNIIPFDPQWLSKPERIRTHVFLCVIGLLFYRLMLWKLRCLSLSLEKLVKELKGIRVGILQKRTGGKPKIMVEEMDRIQSDIFSELSLNRYVP